MEDPRTNKNVPLPTLLVQTTVPTIPMTKMKRRNRKISGALKKPRKVLAALVDVQLTIDNQ